MNYSEWVSILLTSLTILLGVLTIIISLVAWITLRQIKKNAKTMAQQAVKQKLEKLEKDQILPLIQEKISAKVNEQIEIMINNGELKDYIIRSNTDSVIDPESERELQENEGY